MDEEATRVPPASPPTKSGGGSKRSESPGSSSSGGKLVPHYLRASTGSCHEFCKHGKLDERVGGAKDGRPWRKPVTGNGREDSGVASMIKKTVVVKSNSKPSAVHKIVSSPSKYTPGPEMSTATENIDVHTEPSSHSSSAVTGEPYTSNGPGTTLLSVDTVEQDIAVAFENTVVADEGSPSDAKVFEISKKSSASSQSKTSLRRSPSPISPGLNVGRSVDRRKSLEERKSSDGRKAFEGRKSIDEWKNVEERITIVESKDCDESKSEVPETTQKCDNAENSSKGSMSADEMKGVEGSPSSPVMEGSEESKSLKVKGSTKDDSLGNAKIYGKSELLKKQVASPKPVILNMKPPSPLHPSSAPARNPIASKPQSPLHPSSAPPGNPIASKPPCALHPSSAPARNPAALKPPSPLHPSSAPSRDPIVSKPPSPLHPSSAPSRNPIASKPPSPLHPSGAPSRNPIASKPPSFLHPSTGTYSKTIDDNKVTAKLSSYKLEMNKVYTPTVVSPSSEPFINGEGISNTKKVRVIRVVSTVRRQRKVTNVAAKDPNDQGLKEDSAEAIKITSDKEEASSNSPLPVAPPVSKYSVRSRILHEPSHPKNVPADSGLKTATKDASISGLRKSKAVDSQSENHRPSTVKTLKTGRVPLIGETARTNRRSLKKRISAGGNAIEKSNSGRFLSRRPSARQKKNVQVLFNKVIEETASRLVRTSKSKVLALVGAFETVISIQRKSSAVTTIKSKKVSSSSKTSNAV